MPWPPRTRSQFRARYIVESGARMGRLTLVREVRGADGRRRAECLCDCGTSKTVLLQSLFNGDTKSCGCLLRESAGRPPVHGLTSHPLFDTWSNMMQRCSNPARRDYQYYGARGIRVCDSWHDVREFVAWIEANLGPRPAGMTLDRINTDGHYESGNVRWATWSQQQRNRRKLRKSLERGN